jgi:hypothetical protein
VPGCNLGEIFVVKAGSGSGTFPNTMDERETSQQAAPNPPVTSMGNKDKAEPIPSSSLPNKRTITAGAGAPLTGTRSCEIGSSKTVRTKANKAAECN